MLIMLKLESFYCWVQTETSRQSLGIPLLKARLSQPKRPLSVTAYRAVRFEYPSKTRCPDQFKENKLSPEINPLKTLRHWPPRICPAETLCSHERLA